MNRKLKIFEFIDNVRERYPETKDFIDENMNEICKREQKTVEEVIYFVTFLEIIVVRA